VVGEVGLGVLSAPRRILLLQKSDNRQAHPTRCWWSALGWQVEKQISTPQFTPINPLKPEVNLIFKYSVRTSQKTHCVSIRTTELVSLRGNASGLHLASVRLEFQTGYRQCWLRHFVVFLNLSMRTFG
jgi:hypothetical protein